MNKKGKIAKVVKVVQLKDKNTDFDYWRQQSVIDRLETIEEIRLEYHSWRYGGEPRLQRVCSIVKR